MKHREYFYTEPKNISQGTLAIKGDELKHLSRVIRKKVRDIVEVVDGQGNLYTVVLTEISRQHAIGEIQKRTRYVGEPNFHLTLAQAIPRGNRFDLVVEKGTEIGVSTFIPLICEHSTVKASASRISRWKKIAIAAMKQSARSMLPEITSAQTIEEVIRKKGLLKLGLIADTGPGAKTLSNLAAEFKQKSFQLKFAIILIGPEGGFSSHEVKMALDNGFYRFTLGPRRLRSETAGIVASAILMDLIGEMS
ncbi:MAG: 16S rRNA (uracil(1498)-N(3))-methyltransferase [Desulfobacterales bacterium]|nr:MAG: 16S rRNA (uracil(1498)-N(3))-methyltransferase [Desulfobacterales bacterium]